MQRQFRVLLEHAIVAVLFLVPVGLAGQATDSNAAQAANAPAQPDTSQNSQAVSQTGVFPVFAVNMNFQTSLVDGTVAPSTSANNGVDSTLQHTWDMLKGSGFNTIAFPVDLKDPQAAARVANMCIWAKTNNVSLIPVLANAWTGNLAAAFPTAIVSFLRGGDGQQFPAYAQIAFFQLQNPINVPFHETKTSLTETQKQLLAAVDTLRTSELQALAGTGLQATPILVNASFDYELIQQGAIVGVPLDASQEQRAVAAFKKSLLPFAGNGNVNAVRVEWFPRSISSGDEGHFVSLLREVEASVADKKVLLDTGFSTAFNSADQQSQFMTVALTNLAGLRAEEGANGGFIGITVSQAFDNSNQQAGTSPGNFDPSQWNWNEKAKQLAQMWSQGSKSAELTWWLEKVRAGRTLLTTQAGADPIASPGLQAIQQFSATVAQVSQNMTQAAANSGTTPAAVPAAGSDTTASPAGPAAPAPASTPAPADTSANATPAPAASGQTQTPSSPSAFQQTFQSLVQQVTTQLTTSLITKLNNKLNNPSSSQPSYPTQNSASYVQNPSLPGSAPVATPPPAYPAQAATPDAQSSSTTSSSAAAPAVPVDTSAPATPPASQSSGPAISLSPQDVTVDSTNAVAGQPVHITAQLHNASASQAASGLSLQLVDSSNPSSGTQASQGGVSVPPSGVTPVQLTWTPGQTSTTALSLQVMDSNGTQLASATVPLTVGSGANANTGSTTGGGQSGSGSGAQTANNQPGQTPASGNTGTGTGTNATTQTSSSNPASPGQATISTTQTVPVTVIQPKIVYFGTPAAAGIGPSLSLQVTNPAANIINSAQAQLFLDGKPGPTQTLGAFLPNQTRTATFDTSAIPAGTQNLKVVVTTPEGASVTADAAPNPTPGASPGTGPHKALGTVHAGLPVRSGPSSGYRIGSMTAPASMTVTPSSVSGGSHGSGAIAAGLPAPQTAATPSGVAANPTANTSTVSGSSVSPVPSVAPPATTKSPGNNASTQSPAASPMAGVKTIAPQAAAPKSAAIATAVPASSNQATAASGTNVPNSSSPTAVATIAPPSSTSPAGSNTAVRQPAGQIPAVRTIVPPGSAANPASAAPVVPQPRFNQTSTAGANVVPNSPLPTSPVRTIVPQPSTNATTVLPPGSPKPAGGNTLVPQASASTVLPSASPAQPPGVRTFAPQSTTPTVLPTSNANQVAGVRTIGGQSLSGTGQLSTATTVLPPRPGQSLPAQTGSTAAQGFVDLSVAAAEIHFRPAAPGQPLQCTAVIHNIGSLGAIGASVVFTLRADGKALSSSPSVFNVGPGGAYQASWTSIMPAGQSVQLAVQVTAKGDMNAANNQAVIRLR